MNEDLKRRFKNELFEQFARISGALASPKRLELIDLLGQGERTVESLASETGMSVANTSQHLQTLKAAQLVAVRREGLFAHYHLASPDVFALWRALRGVGETHLAELGRVVETYLSDRTTMEGIAIDELQRRLELGDVLLLDVRPASEYQAGHIPGARSIPVSELVERLGSLPLEQEVVAYCRGPYCVFADEAVAFLQECGYRAHRLNEGFPDWQAAGLPVARLAAVPTMPNPSATPDRH